MPKRTDLDSILIIGAGPIIIGQACEFDYSGAQACKALKEEGYRVILVNSNPATIMTDPETRRFDLHRADQLAHHRAHHREGASQRAAADHGRPDGAQHGARSGARGGAREIQRRDDRRLAARHRHGGGPRAVPPRHGRHRTGDRARAHRAQHGRGARGAVGNRLPDRDPALLHARRQRRRHRLQPRGVRGHRGARARRLAHQRGAARGIGARLERVRNGGGARPQRQLHHRLLDREPRSDGRAYRRFDHGGAGADPDRPRVPAPARRLDRGAAQDRRRHRRLERAVRGESGRRPGAGDRNESAGVALLGARLQGDRFSDRQDRRQAGGRLHAR